MKTAIAELERALTLARERVQKVTTVLEALRDLAGEPAHNGRAGGGFVTNPKASGAGPRP